MGWFRPVHRKSPPAQEVRALLVGRKLLQGKLLDIERSIRGLLRGFGPKVGDAPVCTALDEAANVMLTRAGADPCPGSGTGVPPFVGRDSTVAGARNGARPERMA